MQQLTEYEQKAIHRLGESIHAGKWSNAGMVQCIELLTDYLNPVTIQDYANKMGKSYNGIKKTVSATKILNQKYIIDND
jgi:hypothetical protein